MKKRPHTVIVTGAAGFIGFHAALELLAQGWRVVGIDSISDYYDPRLKRKRLSILKKNPSFSFHKADISKFNGIEKIFKAERPDEIVHLAAQAGVRYSISNPWAYVEANELGTLNIFEAAKRSGMRRVIYASSSSVYGANKNSSLKETDRTDHQLAVYGVTKKANETLAHAYNHLFGIEMIGLRLFTVYGTWYRPDMALFKFVKSIASGTPIQVYNRGQMKRSFTHVSDIVSGIVAVLEKKPQGRNEIYNLGGAEAVSLLEFIKLIEIEMGQKANKIMLPMQAGDMRETAADWSKANRDLGFMPKKPIGEGIAEFVAWFRKNEKFLQSLKEPKQ